MYCIIHGKGAAHTSKMCPKVKKSIEEDQEENSFRAQIKQNNDNFHPPRPNNYERRPFAPHNQVNQIENDNNSTAESDYAHQN